VAFTKHAEISLEEMGVENIVITEIPTSRLLYGSRMTSIGHNLNREILRLRPDIGAVIHVHDDATIAFFSSGAFREVKVLSLDLPFILGKPPYYVPAQVDVEADVGPVKGSSPTPTWSSCWAMASPLWDGPFRRPTIGSIR
jgi:ribulose-5-phosphate 4-epimerase/fuculose-1-phosphate aldolase